MGFNSGLKNLIFFFTFSLGIKWPTVSNISKPYNLMILGVYYFLPAHFGYSEKLGA
jgi:hypothetical protein